MTDSSFEQALGSLENLMGDVHIGDLSSLVRATAAFLEVYNRPEIQQKLTVANPPPKELKKWEFD